ncbi:unnamed protein product [Calicophoron daubneyi]|uniref:Saposin B-type domain-containing protein n=1 Tax=Calicophoron daubneyi TaxID=300641 RepID=A0AAV2T9Y3_CALDB
MHHFVFLFLIGLTATSPLGDEVNGRICERCKRAFSVLFTLITSQAPKTLIDAAIRAECREASILQPVCVAALKKLVDYIQSHLHESDAPTVCKKIHIC